MSRPARCVEREEALPEAGDADRVHSLVPAGDDLADERGDLVRVVAAVRGLPQLVDSLAAFAEDLGPDGRGADVKHKYGHHAAKHPWGGMAVVIASNLRKELAGTLLFDGVSFSVERRDRVALSGPNGAGKTTLLRILSGETEKHGGELAFEKGTRVALHDQRPPLDAT